MIVETAPSFSVDRITREQFSTLPKRLTPVLGPGELVSVSLPGDGEYAQHVLFFSDGRLSDEGTFTVQRGKRNFSYVLVSQRNPCRYYLVTQERPELENFGTAVPLVGYNPLDGVSPLEMRNDKLIERVVVGDELAEEFPEAVDALRFARDAAHFNVPTYFEKQFSGLARNSEYAQQQRPQLREMQTCRMSCLRASLGLLDKAYVELNGEDGKAMSGSAFMNAPWTHWGEIKDMVEEHPISTRDSMVFRRDGSSRDALAFVKTGEGIVHGETYILPYTDAMEQVVDLAVSPAMIDKHYPSWLRNSILSDLGVKTRE